MDPATAMLIATAVATAAKGAGDYMSGQSSSKSAKRRSKEMRRETEAGMLQDALQRSAELSAHGIQTRSKLGKRKVQSNQETADLIRGAFRI